MRQKTLYFIGTDKECMNLIEWLDSVGSQWTFYGICAVHDRMGVKFDNPFLTRKVYKEMEAMY
jgi:hypothetical protein